LWVELSVVGLLEDLRACFVVLLSSTARLRFQTVKTVKTVKRAAGDPVTHAASVTLTALPFFPNKDFKKVNSNCTYFVAQENSAVNKS
jgi:hypothetical protein